MFYIGTEYIEFLEGQTNTQAIFWMNLIMTEYRHENTSLSPTAFIPITLAGIYVLLGFSPITKVGHECLIIKY